MIDFTFDYKLWKNGHVIKFGTIRVKQKYSRLHAMSALEDHLRTKFEFDRMTAVDTILGNELPDCFKNLFKH